MNIGSILISYRTAGHKDFIYEFVNAFNMYLTMKTTQTY